jgi:hypothetical protein
MSSKYLKIMKRIKFTVMLAACSLMIIITGCRSQQQVSSSYANTSFESSMINVPGDGTVTIRAWGSGADKAKAIEQAKKNAVYDVIFKDFANGNSYEYKALVTEVNARERYQTYFDRFFSDGGEYLYFVKESSNQDKSRINSKSDSRENFSVVVDVNRNALRQQLVADGVLAK